MLLKEWVYTRTAWRSQLLALLIPLAITVTVLTSPLEGKEQRDGLYAGLVAVIVYTGLSRPTFRVGADFGLGPGAWVLKAGVPSWRVVASKTAFSFLPAAVAVVPIAVITAQTLSLDMVPTLLSVLVCLICSVALSQLLAMMLDNRMLALSMGAVFAVPAFFAPSNLGPDELVITLGSALPLLSALTVPSGVAGGAPPALWAGFALMLQAVALLSLTTHLWERRLLRHLS